MVKHNITVMVRVRPLHKNEPAKSSTIEVSDNRIIEFDFEKTARVFGAIGQRRSKNQSFAFDWVFGAQTPSKAVYDLAAKPAAMDALNGVNATIFAYGATGSGKTHTMIGNKASGPGVILLTMNDIFEKVRGDRGKTEYKLAISYFEVYNEKIFDLLAAGPKRPLPLRQCGAGGNVMVGLSEHFPGSIEEVSELLSRGNLRRSQCPTDKNDESSRSHAIFQIAVEIRAEQKAKSSKLSLIDLAGSERAAGSKNRGSVLREGANINRSLLALGNCINALSRGGAGRAQHVPFRDSCLTRLLRGALAGSCRTVMVATVSAALGSLEDTANTLKYAANARRIRVARAQNVSRERLSPNQCEALIAGLRGEIARLKRGGAPEPPAAAREAAIEREVARVEDTQSSVWRLKRKRLQLELRGRAVETQLQYWTKRREKLALPQTPPVVKRLRDDLAAAGRARAAAGEEVERETAKLASTRGQLLALADTQMRELCGEDAKNLFAANLQSKIERLGAREAQFARLLGEQQRELAALRQNEAAMRAHVCALLETVAYVDALFAGHFEEEIAATAPEIIFTEKERAEMAAAIGNARDIAELYDVDSLRSLQKGALGARAGVLFTPKKFSKRAALFPAESLSPDPFLEADGPFSLKNGEFSALFNRVLNIGTGQAEKAQKNDIGPTQFEPEKVRLVEIKDGTTKTVTATEKSWNKIRITFVPKKTKGAGAAKRVRISTKEMGNSGAKQLRRRELKSNLRVGRFGPALKDKNFMKPLRK